MGDQPIPGQDEDIFLGTYEKKKDWKQTILSMLYPLISSSVRLISFCVESHFPIYLFTLFEKTFFMVLIMVIVIIMIFSPCYSFFFLVATALPPWWLIILARILGSFFFSSFVLVLDGVTIPTDAFN